MPLLKDELFPWEICDPQILKAGATWPAFLHQIVRQ